MKPIRPAYPPPIKPLDANRNLIAHNIHAIAARCRERGNYRDSQTIAIIAAAVKAGQL